MKNLLFTLFAPVLIILARQIEHEPRKPDKFRAERIALNVCIGAALILAAIVLTLIIIKLT